MTDMMPASLEDEDIRDYDLLKDKTRKLKLQSEDSQSIKSSRAESADEFLRNFFIKFGMSKTLDSFQTEFYEKKANGEVMDDEIPEVYARNLELSDELALLQQELDEARIISEKAGGTNVNKNNQVDAGLPKSSMRPTDGIGKITHKLKYEKINHRRVQQEKSKLLKQLNQLKKVYEGNQGKFKELTQKYENIMKEKMIMKLEKERLSAKVDHLQKSLAQIEEGSEEQIRDKTQFQSKLEETGVKKHKNKFQSGVPSEIPPSDPENPAMGDIVEIMNSSLTLLKTFKGHLMGVTGLSYNPNKHILATASDDSTWKLWTIPNGELIMSGEGHQDWLGDCCFHPTNQFIATCSGDGEVKVWDIINAKSAISFNEHPQSAWAVDYHHTGDFLLSCSMDHTIKLWDMNVPKSRFTYRGHVDSVNSVQFQPYS